MLFFGDGVRYCRIRQNLPVGKILIVRILADLSHDPGPLSRGAIHPQRAAEALRALHHSDDAKVSLFRAFLAAGGKTCPVVDKLEMNRCTGSFRTNGHRDARGLSVLKGIAQRLLHDQEQVSRHEVWNGLETSIWTFGLKPETALEVVTKV